MQVRQTEFVRVYVGILMGLWRRAAGQRMGAETMNGWRWRAGLLGLAAALGLAAVGCGDSASLTGEPGDVVEGLRQLGDHERDEVVEKVADMVKHQDEMVSAEAVRALGRMQATRASEVLRKVVGEDKRGVVRQEAVIQLGRRNDAQALPVLRQTVKTDPDPRVRGAAATSVARMGSLPDVGLLMDVAETDDDVLVQTRAVGAIERLVGLKFRYDSKASPEERRKVLERMRSIAATAASSLQEDKLRAGKGPS